MFGCCRRATASASARKRGSSSDSASAPSRQHLQGDQALELYLAGLVDDTHAAATQLLQDLVPGHNWQVWPRHGPIIGRFRCRGLRVEECAGFSSQGAVEFALLLEAHRVLREAPDVIGQLRRLAALLPQQVLAVDQFQGQLGLRPEGRVALQIHLRGGTLTPKPAFALVDAQDRGEPVRGHVAGLGENPVDIGALAPLPKVRQPLLQVEGPRRGGRGGWGHASSPSSPNSRVTRSTARVSCMRRAWGVPPMAEAISAQPCSWARRSASLPLFRRQPTAEFLQQLGPRQELAGTGTARGHLRLAHIHIRDAALVAALGPFLARLIGDLVAGDGDEQFPELGRLIQVVLPRRRAHEEAGQHRLADIHRIEDPAQARIAQVQPNFQADRRLVAAHQLGRRLPVAGANVPQEPGKRASLRVARWVRRRPRGVGRHGTSPGGNEVVRPSIPGPIPLNQ